ncbi:MAG: hypothetical protein ACXWB2_07220 [Acidimicrobiales bacterium]
MVRKVSVLTVCLLALAAVACGRQPKDAAVDVDTGLDAHALAASADQTAQAGTAKVHVSIQTEMTGGSSKGASVGSLTITGDGAFDTTAGLSTMTIDFGSALAGTSEVVQHGDVSYVRASTLATLVPSLAGTWLKIDATQAAAMGTGSSSSLLGGSSGVGDPSAILDYLKGAGADITTVGHEDVDGVDTTHVHATISMQQALDASGADRAKVERSLRQMHGLAQSFESLTLPVDVYIDGNGYVRRVALAFDLTSAAGMTMTMTLDYSEFGRPMTIVEPAAADSADICDLYAALSKRHVAAASMPAGVC